MFDDLIPSADEVRRAIRPSIGNVMREEVLAHIYLPEGENPAPTETGDLGVVYARLDQQAELAKVFFSWDRLPGIIDNAGIWVKLDDSGDYELMRFEAKENQKAVGGQPVFNLFAAQHDHTTQQQGGPLDTAALQSGTLGIVRGGTALSTWTTGAIPLGNGTSAPTFLSPGTSGNLAQSNGSAWVSAAASFNASVITAGILAVARGGTGAGTFTANNVLLGNGTSAFQTVAPSTSGNLLTSNGTTWQSTAPSFNASVISAGTLPVARGGTGKASVTANALLKGDGTNAMQEIAVGTDGYVLKVVAGVPTWAAESGGGGGLTSVAPTDLDGHTSGQTGVVSVTDDNTFAVSQDINVTGNVTVGGVITGYEFDVGFGGFALDVDIHGDLIVDNHIGTNTLGANSATVHTTLQTADLTVTDDASIGGDLAVTGPTTLTGVLNGGIAAFTGALSAASAAITGAITAASATLSGTLQAATVLATSRLGLPTTTPSNDGDAAHANNRLLVRTGGVTQGLLQQWYTQGGTVTIQNTNTETTMVSGTLTNFPANYLNVGTRIRVNITGAFTNNQGAARTMELRVKPNGVTAHTISYSVPALSFLGFHAEFMLSVGSLGAGGGVGSGDISAGGRMEVTMPTVAAGLVASGYTGRQTNNTTAAISLGLTAKWTGYVAGTTLAISIHHMSVDVIG